MRRSQDAANNQEIRMDTATNSPPLITDPSPQRRVIDDPTRVFHWLLAASFAGAWLTSEMAGARLLHVSLGYLAAGLLVFRLVWGFVGPRASAWPVLGRKLMGLRQGWSQGGLQALAVLLILALVGAAAGTGVAQDLGHAALGEPVLEALGEVHEFAGNTALLAVGLHVILVLLGTYWLRNSRLRAMLTGRVPGSGPALLPAYRGLAVLLLLAAIGLGVWQTVGGEHRLGLNAVAAEEARDAARGPHGKDDNKD
jgi:cytochrome b